MKLLAISDLHLAYEVNRRALEQLTPRPDDWLIVAGDVGETLGHLDLALDALQPRFKQLVWVPGNHDLWTLPGSDEEARIPGDALRGEALYFAHVETCQRRGVLTPEDPYPTWTGDGPACRIAPLFMLYDYSFRPPEVPLAEALSWAMESGILCADESYLHPEPYLSRAAWCHARCEETARRLADIPADQSTVLISHFPLHPDVVYLPAVPRFCLWCGTTLTRDWHLRFRAQVVVSGHLHIRSTRYIDGVRFEEVSLGYPHQWHSERGIDAYLREVLPGPQTAFNSL